MIDEVALEEFKTQAIARLEEAESVFGSGWLKKAQGDFIQCPPSAIDQGAFYVMGFNPGTRKRKGHDEPSKPLGETIEELSCIKQEGRHPLEDWARGWTNFTKLAELLPMEDWRHKLFVTNLFPDSSGGVTGWLNTNNRRRNHRECVRQIWPLHQLFLSVVRPRFVIVHGQGSRDSAFRYLWEYLKPESAMNWDDTMADSTRGSDPSIKSFCLPTLDLGAGNSLTNVTFIGIRHLSRSQSHLDVMFNKLIKPTMSLT